VKIKSTITEFKNFTAHCCAKVVNNSFAKQKKGVKSLSLISKFEYAPKKPVYQSITDVSQLKKKLIIKARRKRVRREKVLCFEKLS